MNGANPKYTTAAKEQRGPNDRLYHIQTGINVSTRILGAVAFFTNCDINKQGGAHGGWAGRAYVWTQVNSGHCMWLVHEWRGLAKCSFTG